MNLFSEITEAKTWQVIGNGMHVAQCLIVAVHYMFKKDRITKGSGVRSASLVL